MVIGMSAVGVLVEGKFQESVDGQTRRLAFILFMGLLLAGHVVAKILVFTEFEYAPQYLELVGNHSAASFKEACGITELHNELVDVRFA